MRGWVVDESELPLKDDAGLATVFTIGNGQTCTRGTRPDDDAEASQGVFVSGSFTTAPRGYLYFMDAPDWTVARVTLAGQRVKANRSRRRLDLRRGVLEYSATYESSSYSLSLSEERLVSLSDPWGIAQRVRIRVRRLSTPVSLVLGVDGAVRSDASKYYRSLKTPTCDGRFIRITQPEAVSARGGVVRVGLRSRCEVRCRYVCRRPVGGSYLA
jgi:trehalose/maltose hydrolase-like predicted phosphorylase